MCITRSVSLHNLYSCKNNTCLQLEVTNVLETQTLKLPIKQSRNTQTKYEHAHLSYPSKFYIQKIYVWTVKPSVGEKSCRMELVTQYCSLCLDTAICQQLLLKPSVHTGSRWMSLVNQMQTKLQDASCHSSHQTRGKFRERKRQCTNL